MYVCTIHTPTIRIVHTVPQYIHIITYIPQFPKSLSANKKLFIINDLQGPHAIISQENAIVRGNFNFSNFEFGGS